MSERDRDGGAGRGGGREGGFAADFGEGCEGAADPARRAGAVRSAWAGTVEIRRMLAPSPTEPAPWERERPVRAVAIALEAAGVTPSAVDAEGRRVRTGYRVAEGGPEDEDPVRVEWAGPQGSGVREEAADRLRACIPLLRERGWDALLYYGPGKRPYLGVRAGPGR
ncbi:hypothetical protein [Streptomyces sp. ODS28]|uniref:hypothetical protein n=1 Tax=Streptomyces sp. ODS28 TaxID=3136688 RepID=UPI0031E7B836